MRSDLTASKKPVTAPTPKPPAVPAGESWIASGPRELKHPGAGGRLLIHEIVAVDGRILDRHLHRLENPVVGHFGDHGPEDIALFRRTQVVPGAIQCDYRGILPAQFR